MFVNELKFILLKLQNVVYLQRDLVLVSEKRKIQVL